MPRYSAPSDFIPVDHRPRNVIQQPLVMPSSSNELGGVSSHAAGVSALIAIANALVVLRRHQRGHAFAITQHQKGNFFAFQKFFQHHAGHRRPQQFAVEH